MVLASGWKWKSVTQSCLTLCDPMHYTVHGILQATILEWVALLFSRGSFQPMDPTQVSRIAGGFFTRWATREAQEYWNGRLSLLQQIFSTQESNWGLLHCSQILYQLSYQGSLWRDTIILEANYHDDVFCVEVKCKSIFKIMSPSGYCF